MKVPRIRARAAALYLSGSSIEDVASALHVSYRTARKAILVSGVVLRDPSARLIGRTRPHKTPPVPQAADATAPGLVEYLEARAQEPAVGEPWN